MSAPDLSPAAIAHSFFGGATGGDGAAAAAVVADDVRWRFASDGFAQKIAELVPGVTAPDSGVWEGKEAVLGDLIGPFMERLVPDSVESRVDEIIADGNRVVVLLHFRGEIIGGGVYENDYAIFMQIRDGKIESAVEYVDTLRWLRAFGGA